MLKSISAAISGGAKLRSLSTSQWGKLMESLVEGDLVNLLRARGIAITDTTTQLKLPIGLDAELRKGGVASEQW
ncbi:MAG: hypothetical protein VBE63_07305 [Lamprobacter sp.]|uniref:hypothetical protein n=1 Tax=Lamprobacter sp. TaxID=3100796 RepID=UPI002B258681|nr:hypothetical protein [Lamprobacter sp.]MEA3639735.1 hypothetical protein [Lamprobacter sp.]